MAELQSGEDCTMIDSVVWAKYSNRTDTQIVPLEKCAKNAKKYEKYCTKIVQKLGADSG